MGAIGTKIYDDDTALDVRGDFLDLKDKGADIAKIEHALLEDYIEPGDQDFNDVVILALCCVELETGTLTPATKSKALEVIGSGRQNKLWLAEATKDDGVARERELTLIKRHIEQYDGQPVKRKSWLELQKADAEVSSYADTEIPVTKLRIRDIPIKVWLLLLFSVICFALAFWLASQV